MIAPRERERERLRGAIGYFFLLCLFSPLSSITFSFPPFSFLSSSFLSKAAMTDPAPAVEAAVEAGIISRERRIPLRTLPAPKRAESTD